MVNLILEINFFMKLLESINAWWNTGIVAVDYVITILFLLLAVSFVIKLFFALLRIVFR